MGSRAVKLADVPWPVRRHLLAKQMGWLPSDIDGMPWVDVLWTEHLLGIESRAERALAERKEVT